MHCTGGIAANQCLIVSEFKDDAVRKFDFRLSIHIDIEHREHGFRSHWRRKSS